MVGSLAGGRGSCLRDGTGVASSLAACWAGEAKDLGDSWSSLGEENG